MGKIRTHLPVKLFAAILFNRNIQPESIEKTLTDLFSPIENRSDIFPFSHSEYYGDEMGSDLLKYFVVFQKLIPPEFLISAKQLSNKVEEDFIDSKKTRQVNIDPGYISEAKILLASTKNYDHRIYLGEGIFGDIQLRLRHKQYHENDWTYPDYRLKWVKDFFMDERNKYHRDVHKD